MTTYEAIVDKCEKLYKDQTGEFYGVMVPYALGGKDPLNEVMVYKSEAGIPHWHYITCGFTELDEKENDNNEVSGFGFELTFRLKYENEDKAPIWPINLLQNLARYVFSSGNPFSDGEYIDCNGPIALEHDTEITTLGFCVDPDLGEMDTETGHMVFLEAVGMTKDEMNALMCWSGKKFIKSLLHKIPYGVTDLSRKSLLLDGGFKTMWEKGVEEDGSEISELYMSDIQALKLNVEEHQIFVLKTTKYNCEPLRMMVRNRLATGRKLYIKTPDQVICFEYTEGLPGYGLEEEDFAIILLNESALNQFLEILETSNSMMFMKDFPMIVEIEGGNVPEDEE